MRNPSKQEKQRAAEGVVAALRLSVALDGRSRFFNAREVRRMCGDDAEVFALVSKAVNRRADGRRYGRLEFPEDRIVLARKSDLLRVRGLSLPLIRFANEYAKAKGEEYRRAREEYERARLVNDQLLIR
jgi:hypothetical protein